MKKVNVFFPKYNFQNCMQLLRLSCLGVIFGLFASSESRSPEHRTSFLFLSMPLHVTQSLAPFLTLTRILTYFL